MSREIYVDQEIHSSFRPKCLLAHSSEILSYFVLSQEFREIHGSFFLVSKEISISIKKSLIRSVKSLKKNSGE